MEKYVRFKKLIYRQSQLKESDEKDKQAKLFLLIEEISEIEKAVNAELQFGDQIVDNESEHAATSENDSHQTAFSGLKSLSNVRWSVVYKLAKSFLEHASECSTNQMENFHVFTFHICMNEN